MKKVVFYFHGYGSSSKSDKVNRLRDLGYETCAFDINVNPKVSVSNLIESIDDWVITNINRESIELVFVGTSLGAWYANKMGLLYDVRTVLINPCVDPEKSLKKYGVPEDILSFYDKLVLTQNDTVVIAKNDEVLDFSHEDFSKAKKLIVFDKGTHRFNGPEFEEIISLLV